MAVSFSIGRAGSGKTQRCFDAIVAALKAHPLGPPIYWLLPRQATFQAERQLTCESGLGGFSRARVLSFDKLGREIIADCGGGAVPEVTDVGRQMIIALLLRQNQPRLRFFASAARQPGLAARLDTTFAELERSGKDATDLEALLKAFGPSGGAEDEDLPLREKIHDLHLIYKAYADYLGQERLDQHRRLLQVLAAIDECRLFRDAVVYVDAFLEFTEYERRLIARLGKVCRRVEVTLLMDPASALLREPDLHPQELSLFHRVETAYRRLWFTLKKEQTPVDFPATILRNPARFKTSGLVAIEKHLLAPSRAPTARGIGIDLVEAPNRRAEVDAAARHILDLVAGGYRLRDIAIFLRDLEPYHELIDASFREHGIRYFVDRRRPTAHHPLLQLLRSMLALAARPWAHEGMMTLLKCGLTGLQPREADELENYVLRHRVRGIQWAASEPWNYHRTMTRRSEEPDPDPNDAGTARIDANRQRVAEPLKPFILKAHKGSMPARDFVKAVFDVFEGFGVRKTLAAWIETAAARGLLEQRGEHEQLWAETIKLFDAIVDLIGDERVTLHQFTEVVETALEGFDLALTPPTVDEVLVGQADRTRTGDVKAVLVLGLNEGVFPHITHEDSVLSDAERRALQERQMEIDAGADRRLLDENLLGYLAFTRASERVYASHSRSDAAGKELRESQFWRRFRAIFRDVEVRVVPRDERDRPDCIGTPRQLVTSLMRWVRRGGQESSAQKESPAAPPQDAGQTAPGKPSPVRPAASPIRPAASPPRPAAEPPGSLQGASPVSHTWPALYQWLVSRVGANDAVDEMRRGAWSALRYTNPAALSPDIAEQLFGHPLNATVGRVETFARCPFQHFARYGLDLREREEGDVSVMDMGSVFHQVLERLVRDMVSRRQDWGDLSAEQRQRMIRKHAQEIGQTLRGEILISTARNRYLLQRIEKTLDQVVAAQAAAGRRGKFRPAFTRLNFGDDGGKLPALSIRTPAGRELRLHGVIDRVDVLPARDDQADRMVTVIDYRLGSNRLALDQAYHGISLQLLTYLLVLQASGKQLNGRRLSPAAAFYVQMIRRLEDVGHPSDALSPDDEGFDLTVKPRGIYDAAVVHQLDSSLAPGESSQVISARLRADGKFGYKSSTDVAAPPEFLALLDHVRRKMAQLADGIMSGDVSVTPYWLNKRTPCPACAFRSVCRFETTLNRYHTLQGMKREKVLQAVVEEDARGT